MFYIRINICSAIIWTTGNWWGFVMTRLMWHSLCNYSYAVTEFTWCMVCEERIDYINYMLCFAMYGFALLWWWRYDTETLSALLAVRYVNLVCQDQRLFYVCKSKNMVSICVTYDNLHIQCIFMTCLHWFISIWTQCVFSSIMCPGDNWIINYITIDTG